MGMVLIPVSCIISQTSVHSSSGTLSIRVPDADMLSRFVIDFLPRSKCLLISWLQSPFKVILEPKNRKSVTTSTFSPSICQKVMRLDVMIFIFLNAEEFEDRFFSLLFHPINRLFKLERQSLPQPSQTAYGGHWC